MQNRLTSQLEISPEEKELLLKYFPMGLCAFDLEMTGLSPLFDKIIEIAACKLSLEGKVDYFHSLINPLISIPKHTIQYHQLENKDLRDAPALKKPLKDFVHFYGDTPLLAHSAMFDVGFLIRGLHEFHLNIGLSDVYDSCRFARAVFKGINPAPNDFKLSSLADYFHFEFTHHKAMDDAVVSLKILAATIKQAEIINKNKKINIKELAYLFKLTSFKKSEDYMLPPKLSPLKEATQKRLEIQIKYKGGSMKGEYRPVRPISILPLPQGLILYAECLTSEMNKYYKIKKIQSIKV